MNIKPARSIPTRTRLRPPALTLLEVVLAVVILGLVTAAITGAISAIESMNAHSRQTVAAYEIAHRLVLTWLDDDRRMPTETLPLDYGPYRFMWDKDEAGIRMNINEAQKANSTSTPQALNRFRLFTVNVYMAEGEGLQPYKGPLLASISRMYDPAAPRNPDSMKTISDPEKLGKLLQTITGQDIPLPSGGGKNKPKSGK